MKSFLVLTVAIGVVFGEEPKPIKSTVANVEPEYTYSKPKPAPVTEVKTAELKAPEPRPEPAAAKTYTRGGWKEAKFGMSPVEVIEAMQGKAVFTPKDAEWRISKSPVVIPAYKLGMWDYHVYFFFDASSGLNKIEFRPDAIFEEKVGTYTNKRQPNVIPDLTTLLTAQFGQVLSSTKENQGVLAVENSVWATPDSTISIFSTRATNPILRNMIDTTVTIQPKETNAF